MPIDAFSDDLDSLRELVAQLSTERDAALAECKRVMEQNDRLRHLLQQLRRAQFGRKSERLDPEQLQLAIEDLETAVAGGCRTRQDGANRRSSEEEAEDQSGIAAGASSTFAYYACARQYRMSLLPRRDACDRRGNRRTPRQDPRAVSGDRYTPAEIRLPVMRGRNRAGASAGASDQRRHSHGKPCRRCRGRQIRLAQATLPPGADHAAAGLTGRSLDIGWLGWRRRSRNQAGLSTDERNRARFGENRGR